MDDLIETAELIAFAKTVDARSLSRAAAELSVPRATISRRLARLEERLGVRLLRRTTRSLTLTDAGDAFYRHARIVLDAVTEAEASVRRTDDRLRGPLRVAVPPMLDPVFHDLTCRFAELHPEVHLQIDFASRLVDLQRDGYDVAIRASAELEPGLVARTLARAPLIAVASPSYLERHGEPRHAKDLAKHRCLLGFARGELPQTYWPLLAGGRVHVEGVFVTNEIMLLRDAALRGLGIALLPGTVIEQQIARGELVHVLRGEIGAESRIAIVYPEREFVPPQVRAFVEMIIVWARERLTKGPPAVDAPCAAAGARASRASANAKRARKARL